MPAGRPKGQPKTGGRIKGTPNKSTEAVRQAIAMFVASNTDRFQGWLNSVANGIRSQDGKSWDVLPNPAKALDLMHGFSEFHVPKLARTEHVGDPENPVVHVVSASDAAMTALKSRLKGDGG